MRCSKHVMLATIMQKDVFDHSFRTKALRMKILVARYIFDVKESDDAIRFDL